MNHPTSRYNEIYKGMNASGSKISHPTLSAHLKRMRAPGGFVRLERDRYTVNEKSHQKSFAFIKKVMEAYVDHAGWTARAIRQMSDPQAMVESALFNLEYDFVWTLNQSLVDKDRMEGYVMMNNLATLETMKALILTLWDDPEKHKVVKQICEDWIRKNNEEAEALAQSIVSKLDVSLQPLGKALLDSFSQVVTGQHMKHTIDDWFDAVLKGGRPRQILENALGRKVRFLELLELSQAIRGSRQIAPRSWFAQTHS